MTPLLSHSGPWPTGDAITWAHGQSWYGTAVVGSYAIQPVPHRVDEETLPPGLESWLPRQGISDLLVRCSGSRCRPSWHVMHGLYGFVDLTPGPYVFTVEDPQNRYLPARMVLNVGNHTAVADDLRQLRRPSAADSWRDRLTRILLRPAPGAPPRVGATGIWGEVRDRAGRPIPFAYFQMETRFRGQQATATTWSDPSGGYVLDLDGERADAMDRPPALVLRPGRLCLPLPGTTPDTSPWIDRFPELNSSLLQSIASGIAPPGYGQPLLSTGAGYPGFPAFRFRFRDGPLRTLQESQHIRLQIGRYQRCDLVLV